MGFNSAFKVLMNSAVQDSKIVVIYLQLLIISYNFWGGGATAPQWAMASSFKMFLDQTQRRTTVGRTRLDE